MLFPYINGAKERAEFERGKIEERNLRYMDKIRQYLTYDEAIFTKEETADIASILRKYELEGTEVFMNEACPRTKDLFQDEEGKKEWADRFAALCVKRVHCSYYAYPTNFLTRTHYDEFVQRLGGLQGIVDYYGDLRGVHLFERWTQEYELACALGAQCFVFHTIDYAAIDGAWDFTITREEILQAMVGMVQTFLLYLEEKGLLTSDSPVIELENAGWGLEYGAQRSEDFAEIFNQIYDPYEKVRLGWDVNHLLHAIGWNEKRDGACFMLQDFEITPKMAELERTYGSDPKVFAMKWIESNVLDPAVSGKTSCLHLSDCVLKEVEYFRNGRLQGGYGEKIDAIQGREAQSDYGVGIVLGMYDSHVPMGGEGVILADEMKRIIRELASKNETFVLLHELKNSKPILPALEAQLAFLKDR